MLKYASIIALIVSIVTLLWLVYDTFCENPLSRKENFITKEQVELLFKENTIPLSNSNVRSFTNKDSILKNLDDRISLLEKYKEAVLKDKFDAKSASLDTKIEYAEYKFDRQNKFIFGVILLSLATFVGGFIWMLEFSKKKIEEINQSMLNQITNITGIEIAYLKYNADRYKEILQLKQRKIIMINRVGSNSLDTVLNHFKNIIKFQNIIPKTINNYEPITEDFDLLFINDFEGDWDKDQVIIQKYIAHCKDNNKLVFYLGAKMIVFPEPNTIGVGSRSLYTSEANILDLLRTKNRT